MKTSYWYWKNVFSKDQLLELNKFIEDNFDAYEHPDGPAKGKNNRKIKYCDVKLIYYVKVKKFLDDLLNECYSVNQSEYGFNIWPIYNNRYINYNIYTSKNKGNYGWHLDSLSHDKCSDIKFTVLINTSTKKYEGGDLEHYAHDIHRVEEFTPGSVIMMPSYVLHRVKPVIKGERKTIAIFLHGPKFI